MSQRLDHPRAKSSCAGARDLGRVVDASVDAPCKRHGNGDHNCPLGDSTSLGLIGEQATELLGALAIAPMLHREDGIAPYAIVFGQSDRCITQQSRPRAVGADACADGSTGPG